MKDAEIMRIYKIKEQELKQVIAERAATVFQMKKQLNELRKYFENELKKAEEQRLKQVTALVERLQLKDAEVNAHM